MGRTKKNPETGTELENGAEQTAVEEKSVDVPKGQQGAEPPQAPPSAPQDEVPIFAGEKEGKPAAGAPLFTKEEVEQMVAEASAKAVEEALARVQSNAPQIVQVSPNEEMVQFLFMAEVANENVFEVGPDGMYSKIVGKTGTFYVPKRDLSRVMDAKFRLLMEKRWIIVVDGLSEQEREALGVNYREGELLDNAAFLRMVNLGKDVLKIYPRLCKGHREMVAKRYHEAYVAKNQNVTRDIVTELNNLSKKLGSERGDFVDIIEAMNEADKG